MKNIIKLSLLLSILLTSSYATEVNNIKEMFTNGQINGQIRLGYYLSNPDIAGKTQTASAIGGQLKFETASIEGFSAGLAIYTSHTIDALSGSKDAGDFSGYLSSTEQSYTELAQAYINYSMNDFNIRIGRQLIDTPLADSDDIAMTPNTFEAVILSYALEDLGLTFMVANIQRMQGFDTGYTNVLINNWMDTGDSSTNMFALLYENETIEASTWYYDINKVAKAIYLDGSINFSISSDYSVKVSAQYLSENEEDRSGNEGSIMGVKVDASIGDLNTYIAYNDLSVDANKIIFEGFGGGSSYTTMETTTAGGIGADGKSYAIGADYTFAGIKIFTAYGNFEADSANTIHISELDAGISYEFNEGEADISLIYVDINDRLANNSGESEIKLFANYNF